MNPKLVGLQIECQAAADAYKSALNNQYQQEANSQVAQSVAKEAKVQASRAKQIYMDTANALKAEDEAEQTRAKLATGMSVLGGRKNV